MGILWSPCKSKRKFCRYWSIRSVRSSVTIKTFSPGGKLGKKIWPEKAQWNVFFSWIKKKIIRLSGLSEATAGGNRESRARNLKRPFRDHFASAESRVTSWNLCEISVSVRRRSNNILACWEPRLKFLYCKFANFCYRLIAGMLFSGVQLRNGVFYCSRQRGSNTVISMLSHFTRGRECLSKQFENFNFQGYDVRR